jgi:hypothetical protein
MLLLGVGHSRSCREEVEGSLSAVHENFGRKLVLPITEIDQFNTDLPFSVGSPFLAFLLLQSSSYSVPMKWCSLVLRAWNSHCFWVASILLDGPVLVQTEDLRGRLWVIGTAVESRGATVTAKLNLKH